MNPSREEVLFALALETDRSAKSDYSYGSWLSRILERFRTRIAFQAFCYHRRYSYLIEAL
jgi:hypothetical protein